MTTEALSLREHVVLLNVFQVKPGRAEALLVKLAQATEEAVSRCPGFISARFHRSLDGTSVVNYAQWASVAHFEAMRADPVAQRHIAECAALSEGFVPQLLQVVSVHTSG